VIGVACTKRSFASKTLVPRGLRAYWCTVHRAWHGASQPRFQVKVPKLSAKHSSLISTEIGRLFK
jgi:hypothetical protein